MAAEEELLELWLKWLKSLFGFRSELRERSCHKWRNVIKRTDKTDSAEGTRRGEPQPRLSLTALRRQRGRRRGTDRRRRRRRERRDLDLSHSQPKAALPNITPQQLLEFITIPFLIAPTLLCLNSNPHNTQLFRRVLNGQSPRLIETFRWCSSHPEPTPQATNP